MKYQKITNNVHQSFGEKSQKMMTLAINFAD